VVRTVPNRAKPRRRDFQKGNQDSEGIEPRTSRREVKRLRGVGRRAAKWQ